MTWKTVFLPDTFAFLRTTIPEHSVFPYTEALPSAKPD